MTGRSASGAASRPLGANRHLVTLTSADLERTAIVYLPPRGRQRDRLPLVLNLHGSGSGPLEQLRMSELESTAQRHGFIVAAPQAALPARAGHAWNVPHAGLAQRAVGSAPPAGSGAGARAGAAEPDDERFLLDLVDAIVSAGYADPHRVFATGLSGGGRMVSQLAADHPGRFAAIGPVAGLRAGAPSSADPGVPDPTTCAPEVPVPVVTFHGTADPFNVFTGGGEPYWGYSAPTALRRWAELNGCARGPVEERLTEHVSVVSYASCAEGAEAVMYVVEGGGHTWPGSRARFPANLGAVTHEISANELMWQFFADRSR